VQIFTGGGYISRMIRHEDTRTWNGVASSRKEEVGKSYEFVWGLEWEVINVGMASGSP
jgi:hypothetical protein